MSSLLRGIKQTPSRVGYFRGDNPGSDATVDFIYYPLKLTVGSFGVVRIDNGNIYFDTYANAVDFIQDPASNGNASATIVNGEIYRDMGKTYNIFVGQYRSDNLQHVATLTKVQRYTTDGQTNEGVTGADFSNLTVPPVGNNYRTGYIVTWSSNPNAGAGLGIPVGGLRTGY